MRYARGGMFIAPCMVKESKEFFASQDKLGLFIEERMAFEAGAVASTKTIYTDWLNWLDEIDGTGASRKYGGSIHKFVRDLNLSLHVS